jgi:hypothetical protein
MERYASAGTATGFTLTRKPVRDGRFGRPERSEGLGAAQFLRCT